MLRYILLSAATLSLLSSSTATSCITSEISRPECEVGDNSAALLVTVRCAKSVRCGPRGDTVADVVVDKVFNDTTGLILTEGAMVTVHFDLDVHAVNGLTPFQPSEQWILFARERRSREELEADLVERSKGSAVALELFLEDYKLSAEEFSDGSVCNVGSSDLTATEYCARRNMLNPTESQIQHLTMACSSDSIPATPTDRNSTRDRTP